MRPISGIAACAQAARELVAEPDADGCLRKGEGLRVGIGGDEFDAFDAFFDHAVDGVLSAAANADDLDAGEGFYGLVLSGRVHLFLHENVKCTGDVLVLENVMEILTSRSRIPGVQK